MKAMPYGPIRFSALDYLLKPIDDIELQEAWKRPTRRWKFTGEASYGGYAVEEHRPHLRGTNDRLYRSMMAWNSSM
ncbi:MAG: hypothetical protein IPL64_02795 [Flavobacteriales bacterium]|nr:hypothetical protein [Flavobacteriales bacterium]